MALTKSRRVKIIQEIAEHLSTQGWTTVDLTLKQFGFPITDSWSGHRDCMMVVEMVGDGNAPI